NVPVAAVSLTAAHMDRGTSLMLGGFGLLLVVGLVGILRAANGPAQVLPKQSMSPTLKRRSMVGMSIGAIFILVVLVSGDLWWNTEATANETMVYRVPELQAQLKAPGVLKITLENPNSRSFGDNQWRNFWAQSVVLNDLVPDHGHLMHLFLVSMPDMKSF